MHLLKLALSSRLLLCGCEISSSRVGLVADGSVHARRLDVRFLSFVLLLQGLRSCIITAQDHETMSLIRLCCVSFTSLVLHSDGRKPRQLAV